MGKTPAIVALLLTTTVAVADEARDPALEAPTATRAAGKSDDGSRLPTTELSRTETVHASTTRPAQQAAPPAPEIDLAAAIADWPPRSRDAAALIAEKYGAPDEASPSRLVWEQTGPWKRTIVHRDEVAHDFPLPHGDVVEQVLDYQVPVDRIGELVAYDGSLVVARTRGELSVTCDREEMNYVAINLAHQIAGGTLSAKEARKTHHAHAREVLKTFGAKKRGWGWEMPAYATKLEFTPPSGVTADADAPLKR